MAGERNVSVGERKGRWDQWRATVVHCHIPCALYRLRMYENEGASGDVDENKGRKGRCQVSGVRCQVSDVRGQMPGISVV